ncbi:hypothetical protein [Thiomicrospira sp. ALE5]|uniref:hypothetical protein n=1 Tax=Thiomicrospira sp. ALE5 TaxID=748650 RepID=UPI0013564174|nr:hypothetical protein [Thiomicrospira sp. ALE5]
MFELFQNLWDQKILILTLAVLLPVIAFVYVTYIDRKPNTFNGSLLIELASFQFVNKSDPAIQFIESADNLAQVSSRLSSVTATVPRGTQGLINLGLTDLDPNSAKQRLEKIFADVKARHEQKLANLQNIQIISPTSQIGDIVINEKSGLEKRNLVVAVAFVLGGMLGVFIALIRSAVRKRREQLPAN